MTYYMQLAWKYRAMCVYSAIHTHVRGIAAHMYASTCMHTYGTTSRTASILCTDEHHISEHYLVRVGSTLFAPGRRRTE